MFDLFSIMDDDGKIKISNRIVYINANPIGIITPSALIAYDDQQTLSVISGPYGVIKIESESVEYLVEALIKTGSILFGKEHDIFGCIEYLENPITSRTASYLCSVSNNCSQVCEAIHNIQNAKVCIIGCGGIGSLSAINIAGAGVRNIQLIDEDIIELSNLNRQFFWRKQDLGRQKVDVLARELSERYSHINLSVMEEKVESNNIQEITQGYDLIFLTADEPLGIGVEELKSLAYKGLIKLIACGYFHSNLIVEYVTNSYVKSDKHTKLNWMRNPWFIGGL